MAGPGRNTVYVSVQLSREEKAALDDAVRESGLTRNRFFRQWIADLAARGSKA